MPLFDPTTYPGPRPPGPCLLHGGAMTPFSLAPAGPMSLRASVPVPGGLHWTLAYGSNACPARLHDKDADRDGAVLVPVRVDGWAAAWESRRSPGTGAVPVTLVPRTGAVLDAWLLGVDARAAAAVDRSEGRGRSYVVGLVGPVVVGDLLEVPTVPAYGPGRATALLADDDGRAATWPTRDQSWARDRLEAGAPTVLAPPLPDPVPSGFPTSFRLVGPGTR